MTKDYIYDAVVASIYDGDSLRLNIDMGFDQWSHNVAMRLYGLDAPELRGEERPAGLVARDWLRERLPVGSSVELHSIRDRTGKYGRYLALLYKDGECLNDAMIAAGQAALYREGL